MMDPCFNTIPVFNEAVAVILGKLYGQHPVPLRTHAVILSDGQMPDDWDLHLTDRQHVFEATIAWLEAEGFVRETGSGTCDGFTGELTLTFKGLAAVNGVPPMLALGEGSKTFGEALKEAVKEKAAAELANLGSGLLQTAGAWMLGKLGQ